MSAVELLIKHRIPCVSIGGHTSINQALVISFYLITRKTVQLSDSRIKFKETTEAKGKKEAIILTTEERLYI